MVGRFAPSPTGPLHLGSLRTALVAWLTARSAGSGFMVRIEDLDPQRSRRAWEAIQLADLRALGLDWDGEPVRQSERRPVHEAALDQLRVAGVVYPCFCTRAEIRAAAGAPHGAWPEGAYPGTCRTLPHSVRAVRIAAGQPHALRLDARAAADGDGDGDAPWVAYRDRLLGDVTGIVDDFVLRRADGVPAYQLAVVVDDGAQGIEQVVRGADLADSTPRQILLARVLGLPVPQYAHLGLVLGSDGTRLAKRHGAVTLADAPFGSGAAGGPVAATLGWLARSLGLGDGRTQVTQAAELLPGFDLDAVAREPVTVA